MLIGVKSFFDIPIKNKEEKYEKIIEMGRNNDYTTGNLLEYEYFKKQYKLIPIDTSKLVELENPNLNQRINFIGRPDRDDIVIFFFDRQKTRKNHS